ncbi:MAG TPA: 2,4'-dihydroxyacetophenone dioxygenase family protein [Woeseiaceae bacterium]|nr:2,4'-dihydroxyacetophenone dioxygenase family protein [Woeseiaceae bacterium]
MHYIVENDHRADPASWRPLAPGIAMQILRMSRETGQYTVIIQADKGSVLPRHRHLSPSEIYILSGSGTHPQTGTFKADDYIYENAGAVHDAVMFDEPVKLLMVSYGASAFLDDNDQVLFLLDVHQLQNDTGP